MELSEIREQSAKAAEQVCEAAKLKIGDLFVVGCSSSEILGEKIGTHSSVEVAEAVFEGIHSVLHEHGVELAAQCCEHLNRALIVERAVAEQFGLEDDVTVSMLSRCPEVLTMEQVPEDEEHMWAMLQEVLKGREY